MSGALLTQIEWLWRDARAALGYAAPATSQPTPAPAPAPVPEGKRVKCQCFSTVHTAHRSGLCDGLSSFTLRAPDGKEMGRYFLCGTCAAHYETFKFTRVPMDTPKDAPQDGDCECRLRHGDRASHYRGPVKRPGKTQCGGVSTRRAVQKGGGTFSRKLCDDCAALYDKRLPSVRIVDL